MPENLRAFDKIRSDQRDLQIHAGKVPKMVQSK